MEVAVHEVVGGYIPFESIKQTHDTSAAYNECGGVTKKVLGTVNGEKVMIKSQDDEEESYAEYFAYKLGTAIGINVNRVEIIDCGDLLGLTPICSVHYWEDGFEKVRNSGRELYDYEEQIMEFFDMIIKNTDRHGGNYGIVNNELFLIDNGFSDIKRCSMTNYMKNRTTDKIIRALTGSPKTREVVEKFCNLTFDELYEIASIPENINYPDIENHIDCTLSRMFMIQDMVRNEIIESGGKQTWLM